MSRIQSQNRIGEATLTIGGLDPTVRKERSLRHQIKIAVQIAIQKTHCRNVKNSSRGTHLFYCSIGQKLEKSKLNQQTTTTANPVTQASQLPTTKEKANKWMARSTAVNQFDTNIIRVYIIINTALTYCTLKDAM